MNLFIKRLIWQLLLTILQKTYYRYLFYSLYFIQYLLAIELINYKKNTFSSKSLAHNHMFLKLFYKITDTFFRDDARVRRRIDDTGCVSDGDCLYYGDEPYGEHQ